MTSANSIMLSPMEQLQQVAGRLPLLRLQLQIQMQQAGEFDQDAGALFHGSFGWALHEVAPELWDLAYGELTQQESRPFCILPPALPCQWQRGDTVTFAIVALATMALQPDRLLATVIRMGKRGLGSRQIRFTLQQATQLTPDGPILLLLQGVAVTARPAPTSVLARAVEQANTLAAVMSDVAIRVQCSSRLRLKDQGKVLRRAPTALQIARAICRRLCTVQQVNEAEKTALYQLLSPLEQIVLRQDESRQDQMQRYSNKQQQQHPIEGICGWWLYSGAAVPMLLPWLAIGQWLQLGGKTSFGFGAIEWQLVVLEPGGQLERLAE